MSLEGSGEERERQVEAAYQRQADAFYGHRADTSDVLPPRAKSPLPPNAAWDYFRKHPGMLALYLLCISAFFTALILILIATNPTHHPAARASTPVVSAPGAGGLAGPAALPAKRTYTFSGTGEKDLGTIRVLTKSTLIWECVSCTHTNFDVEAYNADDTESIDVNGYNQSGGMVAVVPATYQGVEVDSSGTGLWTLEIRPTP